MDAFMRDTMPWAALFRFVAPVAHRDFAVVVDGGYYKRNMHWDTPEQARAYCRAHDVPYEERTEKGNWVTPMQGELLFAGKAHGPSKGLIRCCVLLPCTNTSAAILVTRKSLKRKWWRCGCARCTWAATIPTAERGANGKNGTS